MRAPGKWTVAMLFKGKARERELFETVREYIVALGPSSIDVAKTQVSFGTGRKFAWVWLPPEWAKRLGGSVVLSFSLGRRVIDSRIKQSVEPYPGRWMHHVVISEKGGLDKRVRGWLKLAYVWSMKKDKSGPRFMPAGK